jgi:hypothetical protein
MVKIILQFLNRGGDTPEEQNRKIAFCAVFLPEDKEENCGWELLDLIIRHTDKTQTLRPSHNYTPGRSFASSTSGTKNKISR